jgi:hypothetical protein
MANVRRINLLAMNEYSWLAHTTVSRRFRNCEHQAINQSGARHA